MKSLKRAIIAAGVLSAATLSAGVQAEGLDGLYIPFGGDYHDFDTDRHVTDQGFGTFGLGYELNENVALEFMYTNGDAPVDKAWNGEKAYADYDGYRLDALLFLGDGSFRPYLLGGVGYHEFNPSMQSKFEDHTINLGVGVIKDLTDNWSLRSDITGLINIDEDQTEYAVRLLVQYRFGERSRPAPEPEDEPAPAPMTEAEPPRIELQVNFAFDSDEIPPGKNDDITEVAEFMKEYQSVTVEIEGHTDSMGSEAYNQDLSERRANAVRNRLVQKHGLQEERVSAMGYGEIRPVADNATSEGRAENRRIEAVFGGY